MWLLKWPSGRADDAFIDLHRSDGLSPSGDDAIKFHVIFERACACGVIIIGRSKPHQNAVLSMESHPSHHAMKYLPRFW